MLQITKNGNSIIVKGIDNKQYPDNGTLTIPVNNLIVVVDESNIATFRSASNNDVLFSGVIDDITIDGAAVTKDTIGEKFGTLANASTGGEGGEYTAGNGIKIEEKVISISDTLSTEISDKADKADVTAIETKVDTNTANIATKANASDVYTKTEVDTKITEVEGKIPDVSVYETKEDAAATYQVKGDYALKSDIPTVPTKVSELENDAKYITKADIPEVDLSNYYKKSETYSKEEVDTQLATKVEMSVLDNYYDKTEADAKYATQEVVNEEIAARIKADGEINTTLLTKADKTEIPTVPTNVSAFTNDANYITIADVPEVDLSPYAKTADVDTKLANKVDNTTYTTDKAALEADIATKANTSDVYTKTESDEKYLAKTDAATTYAEKATTLSGYGITDAYTQEEVDEKLKNVGGDEELDYGTAYALNDVEAKIYRVYDQVKPLENKITQLKTKITSLEESLTALDNKLNDYEEVIERRMATILNDLNSKIK